MNEMSEAEYCRGERYVYREIGGEHLLIALHGDSPEPLFGLTPTGALLWARLETWSTKEELVNELVSRYEVSREQASKDVDDFLAQLEELRAVSFRGRTR
jgi:hypothetical protein